MNKLGTKLGAIAMSAVMALSFAPSAAITSLAADGELDDAVEAGVENVYVVYNPNSGEHLFTTNHDEVIDLLDAGWGEGDVAWVAPTVAGDPVYRIYNPNVFDPTGIPLGDHHYTTDKAEADKAVAAGWKYDNDGEPVFYSADSEDEPSTAIYCAYNPNAYKTPNYSGAHHLTIDEAEYDGLVENGWTGEGAKFYGYEEGYEPGPVVEELTVSINNTTPKVGDTLEAVTTGEVVSYAWAESDDGVTWTPILGADKATFGVTEASLGKYIKVTVIGADAKEASDATTSPVAEATVIGDIEIVSAEATKANVVTVTLAAGVISSDTTIELKKGTSVISVTDSWNSTFDEVTLTAAANLTEGEYTVTLTSKTDETNTDTATFEVKKNTDIVIVIDTDTALTDANKKIAYAHYDVFDQYGESVRSSTSITWAGSATITGDKATGKLTLRKTSDTDWVFGEQIYVTGVYTKTGAAVNKVLTVGQGQELDSLEIAGFLKKGTSTIVKTLPADLKEKTYYLLFNGLDQNGVQLKNDLVGADDVTFVSDNVLVVKSIGAIENPITVDGVEYCSAFVEPGIKVSDGGTTTITAIANKTGNKTEFPVIVGVDRVVTSFALAGPSEIVADGDEDVEIPFTALDQNGDAITDFVTLAKQETFNTLSFSASEGTLKLEEQADGSAKLTWSDSTPPGWTSGLTTDGIDRPISLTAIVVGGTTDNEMIAVSDKRRPNGILAVNMDEVYTEGADFTFSASGNTTTDSFKSFQFVDQYGKTIPGTDKDKKWGDSTGFFRANSANFVDTDLKDYWFGVKVTYAGPGNINYKSGCAPHSLDNGVIGTPTTDPITGEQHIKEAVLRYLGGKNMDLTLTTGTEVVSVASGEGFKFEITKIASNEEVAKKLNTEDWETFSPTKFVSVTIVDLSQIKSFTASTKAKLYVGKDDAYTDAGVIKQAGRTELDKDEKTAFTPNGSTGLGDDTNYQKEVEVKGTYNGKEVKIPAKFYTVVGSKVSTATELLNDNKVTVVKELYLNDLYDKASAKGVSKDAEDTLKVTIYHVYGGESDYNTAEVSYYDYKDVTATTATAAALITTDDQAGVDKAVELKKISKGLVTFTDLATLIGEANTRLTDLAAATTATAAGIITDYVNGQDPAQLDRPTLYTAVYDTATTKVKLSDQDPAASKIDGLKDTYTLRPDFTDLYTDDITDGIGVTSTPVTVTVLDQYDVQVTTDLTYRATDVVENKDGYAANNFSVSGNDTASITINGGERGDKFTLVLTQGGATASTSVTLGADKMSYISDDDGNRWLVLKNGTIWHDGLEAQRLAGLG